MSEKSYNFISCACLPGYRLHEFGAFVTIQGNLVSYLANLPLMRVIRVLLRAQTPRHLRDIVVCCGLSPGGVSDILRRLSEHGVVHETKEGNRCCYRLSVTADERAALEMIFTSFEKGALEERAKGFSRTAKEKIAWMDETYSFLKKAKAKMHDSA